RRRRPLGPAGSARASERRAAHVPAQPSGLTAFRDTTFLGDDMPAPWPLRFGVFYAPFHPVGQNPTLALEYDLERVVALDALGYDEAWFGEHHSGGYEIIASPEIFIAAAAERTKHIKLGTGVVSLPYHHPWLVADRLVLLDHLTRGRLIFGAGPGA